MYALMKGRTCEMFSSTYFYFFLPVFLSSRLSPPALKLTLPNTLPSLTLNTINHELHPLTKTMCLNLSRSTPLRQTFISDYYLHYFQQ